MLISMSCPGQKAVEWNGCLPVNCQPERKGAAEDLAIFLRQSGCKTRCSGEAERPVVPLLNSSTALEKRERRRWRGRKSENPAGE